MTRKFTVVVHSGRFDFEADDDALDCEIEGEAERTMMENADYHFEEVAPEIAGETR